jgi:hypothetical protein
MSIEEVRSVIQRSLQDKAGAVLMNLVKKLLDQSAQDPGTLASNLVKIRVSIELFVDERLAMDVYERARTAAGL